MGKRTIIIMAAVFLIAVALLGIGECGYDKIEAIRTMESAVTTVRADFPSVKSVSSKALQLYQSSGTPLLLVDVRGEEEYEISHLPGAVNFEKTDELIEHVEKQSEKPETIVVYGSLGFRSAEFAEKAGKNIAGIENLEGGIFAWANEGLPLEDTQGRPATIVHPYNKMWGRLLEKERRAVIE